MERLVAVGLSNALVALVLAVVAGLVGLLCRRPALVHALWLLVLLKLVTPPLASIRLPSPAAPVEAPPAVAAEEAVVAVEPDAMGPAAEEAGGPVEPNPEAQVEREVAPPVGPEPEEELPAPAADWWAAHGTECVGGVWVAGSLAWFALAVRRVWRFRRVVRWGRPAPAALVQRVDRLAARVQLRRRPRVLLVPGRLPPMVWGLGRPTLLVPEELEGQVGAKGLDTLLLHELAHVRRRDHWVRWLEFAALGLFWWNPVAWYARRELREAEEQCCDAWVVAALPGARREYATALVDALDFLCDPRPALPPLASGLGGVADVKRRLTMIVRGTTPARLGRSSSLGVLTLALLLLPLVPVWGQAQDKPDGPQEKRFLFFADRDADLQKLRIDIDRKIARAAEKDADGADLEKLQAEIARKAQELLALKEKLDALKQRADAEAIRKKLEAGREKLQAFRVRVWDAATGQAVNPGPTIRIEISGLALNAEELKKVAEALQKHLPGKQKRVTILATPLKPTTAVPRMGGGGIGIPRAIAKIDPPRDSRIDSVEKKLDLLLRELEAMRKEMRGPQRGGPSGTGGQGGQGGKPGLPGLPGRPALPGRPGGDPGN